MAQIGAAAGREAPTWFAVAVPGERSKFFIVISVSVVDSWQNRRNPAGF
jgi:hypothetical protein